MVAVGLLAVRLAVRLGAPIEPVGPAVDRMAATADVLRLSHYTAEVVRHGQVLQQGEYQAALEDLRQLRRDWEPIRGRLPADQAADVEQALHLLETRVRQRRPPEEVAAAAEQLIARLHALNRAPGRR